MSVPGGVPLSAVQTTKSGARDDCFGQFLVLVSRVWGASRHIEPEALARIAGQSVNAGETRDAHAVLELREEGRRCDRGFEAEGAWCAEESH